MIFFLKQKVKIILSSLKSSNIIEMKWKTIAHNKFKRVPIFVYVLSALTFGSAAGGYIFTILLVTIKVTVSVTADDHELFLVARDGEIEGRVEPRYIPGLRHALYITVMGYIH